MLMKVMDEKGHPLLENQQISPGCSHAKDRGALLRRTFLALGVLATTLFYLDCIPIISSVSSIRRANSFQHGSAKQHVDSATLQDILLTVPDVNRIRDTTKYYASGLHLAGTNRSQAEWTRDQWIRSGVPEVEIVTYDTFLNYPKSQRLALINSTAGKDNVFFEATLREDTIEGQEPSPTIPPFHGYSASGNITAQYLYANFGSREDFTDLVNVGVRLEGKIAIVKSGQIGRSLKIQAAENFGLSGVIMYTDPQQDGLITEEHGFEPYPSGPARNPTTVERGSVISHLSKPGDPTTPGYASTAGCRRMDANSSLPSIPSLPISYADAVPLLKALNGHGLRASEFGSRWHGGGLGYKGVNYNIGPSPEDIVLNLDSQQEYVTTPIWNVIGTIKGEVEDEVIILGNHRDSWSSGAADPNSGSAVLIETIRSFGVALKHGWKPRRTIMFGSWDGQEYAFLGSTEWTEENFSWLSASTVAYLNVVVAASGKYFNAHASPLLQKVIHSATNKVLSPNQTSPGQTVLNVWGGKLSPAGGGDAIIFLDTLGISTVDIGFSAGPEDPIYPYHSSYDTLDWMDRFGDPTWEYHRAITQIWSLMAASLVEAPLLPLRVTDYAEHFQTYLRALKGLAPPRFNFHTLEVAINQFYHASLHFDAYATSLEGSSTCSSSKADTSRSRIAESNRKCKTSSRIRAVNKIYKKIERMFLYEPGLDHRSWVKHVVYAPSSYYSSSAAFPGLVESFAAGNVTNANRWQNIIVSKINDARDLLELDVTLDT